LLLFFAMSKARTTTPLIGVNTCLLFSAFEKNYLACIMVFQGNLLEGLKLRKVVFGGSCKGKRG